MDSLDEAIRDLRALVLYRIASNKRIKCELSTIRLLVNEMGDFEVMAALRAKTLVMGRVLGSSDRNIQTAEERQIKRNCASLRTSVHEAGTTRESDVSTKSKGRMRAGFVGIFVLGIVISAAVVIHQIQQAPSTYGNRAASSAAKESGPRSHTRNTEEQSQISAELKEEIDLTQGFLPRSGEDLIKPILFSGEGELTVVNDSDRDGLLKLYEERKGGGTLYRYWFLGSKHRMTVTDLGPCDCSLYFALGRDWDDERKLFRREKEYGRHEASLSYEVPRASEKAEWKRYWIRIDEGPTGIASSIFVDEKTFNDLY